MREFLEAMAQPGSYVNWQAAAEQALVLLEGSESRLLLQHWRHGGVGDRPPGRRDIDPTGFGAALPFVWLMDYLPEQRRLRYRLAGEDVNSRYPEGLSGRHLDEVVDSDALPQVADYFLACPETPAITLLKGRLYQEWQKPGQGERLLLPLIDTEGAPEGLIGVTLCRRTFPNREEAERATSRRVLVLPLDGSAPREAVS